MKMPETLGAVHTHTHTHTSNLKNENKYKRKIMSKTYFT